MNTYKSEFRIIPIDPCHASESWHPSGQGKLFWMPAFAGMTGPIGMTVIKIIGNSRYKLFNVAF